MRVSLKRFATTSVSAALGVIALVCAATQASAQYYPYPPPGYYPPPPPPVYYPQPQPYYVPQQPPPGYYTPRPSRNAVAEQCATQYGTCSIGPTRPGRGCNCFFPGSGKIPGVAVR